MQYIAAHTDVPPPKFYAVHIEDKQYIYIEMAYIQGKTLEDAWRGLTSNQRLAIMADLSQHISRIRELPPPAEHVVSSTLQNPGYDSRIGHRFFGPLNIREFQVLLRRYMPTDCIEEHLGREVAAVHADGSSYQICFTLADSAPKNIMVRNGRVAAILDWTYSGWYPEYWEYTKTHWNLFWSEEWGELFRSYFPRYELELEAERTLWRRVDDPGTPATLTNAEGETFMLQGSKPSADWMDARAGRPLTDLWSVVLPAYL